MLEEIQDTVVRTARKEHECSSCLWIREMIQGTGNPFTFAEWRLIVAAKRDNWKILKGQQHEHSVWKYDGLVYSYRSRFGLSGICHKYELFADL